MPLFLDAKRYIRVPLEETYEATWKACPQGFKQRNSGWPQHKTGDNTLTARYAAGGNSTGVFMPAVQLNDQVFKVAQRRASDAGYSSVDAYVSAVLVDTDAENIDHLFTLQRLAHIDKADAEIQAGKGYTAEQAEKELAQRREKWLQSNPR